jgi:glycosyltransferase involved in cell wall biosynthesis
MIAFTTTNTITCGGLLVVFEYVKRLKARGYEADIFAEEGNPELEKSFGIEVQPFSKVLDLTADDTIIAVRWEQCEYLSPLPCKKFQLVQGDDIALLGDDVTRAECSKWRKDERWNLIGVSQFVLMRWGRGVVVPNGVNERFFQRLNLPRDIDVLVEGNNEINKNIGVALQIAKDSGAKTIVWLGRETVPVEGVECISNPKQEDIPALYQRAKVMIKLSKSEGFCLPILEAMASGSLVATTNMGGNDSWCVEGSNCIMDNLANEIKEHLENGKHRWVIEKAYITARQFEWEKSVSQLLKAIC